MSGKHNIQTTITDHPAVSQAEKPSIVSCDFYTVATLYYVG